MGGVSRHKPTRRGDGKLGEHNKPRNICEARGHPIAIPPKSPARNLDQCYGVRTSMHLSLLPWVGKQNRGTSRGEMERAVLIQGTLVFPAHV